MNHTKEAFLVGVGFHYLITHPRRLNLIIKALITQRTPDNSIYDPLGDKHETN